MLNFFIIIAMNLLVSMSHADGTWHKPFIDSSRIRDITTDDTHVWCATEESGMLLWDKAGHSFSTITKEDGLASNEVYAVEFDRDGVLWIGTDKCVQSFDGESWATYTMTDGLPDKTVTNIYVDENNNKWLIYGYYASGSGGEIPYWLDDEGIVHSHTLAVNTWPDGVAQSQMSAVNTVFMDSKGLLWFGTTGGVWTFDGDRWTQIYLDEMKPVHSVITAIAETPDGAMWFGGVYGVLKLKDGIWTHYDFMEIFNFTSHPDNYNIIMRILVDDDGGVWVDTSPFGIYNYYFSEDGGWELSHEKFGLHLPYFHFDRDGVIWFSRSGLGRYKDGVSEVYIPAPSYMSVLSTLTGATDGTIWASGFNNIDRYSGNYWTRGYESTHSNDDIVDAAEGPVGVLWWGLNRRLPSTGDVNGGVLVSFDGETWTEHNLSTGENPWPVSSIAVGPDNTVWIASSDGVMCYDGISSRYYTSDDTPHLVSGTREAAISRDNVKWFTVPDGHPIWYDGASWGELSFGDVSATGEVLSVVVDGGNNKWFMTSDAYIIRYDGTSSAVFQPVRFNKRSNVNSFAHGSDNTLWVCTDEKMLRFDGTRWDIIDPWLFLGRTTVKQVIVDNQNRPWIIYNYGIACYTPEPILEVAEDEQPAVFPALSVYPNPFNVSTVIVLSLPEESRIEVSIHNIAGQKIASVHSGILPRGRHMFTWNAAGTPGHELSSGIYFVRCAGERFAVTEKMLFLK